LKALMLQANTGSSKSVKQNSPCLQRIWL